MKKNTKIRLILILGIFIAILWMIMFSRSDQQTSWKHALQIYGCLPYIENETTVTFAVITSRDTILSEDICTLSFPETNIAASNVSCREAVSTPKGILWLIDAELRVELPCKDTEISITRMIYNQEEYGIGQLRLLILPNARYENGFLELKSSLGASIGRGLKPYHAEFENIGNDIIDTYDMVFPMYENARNNYQIDNHQNTASILPGSHLYAEADFSDCSYPEDAVCFYVTPILTYEYQGETYYECKPYYTCGYFLSEEDVDYYIDLHIMEGL